ncbi:MAG: hypothetical protein CMH28_08115 [Micavibrio sp.]|nr:hypothetical protein [Micavibrio sp.]
MPTKKPYLFDTHSFDSDAVVKPEDTEEEDMPVIFSEEEVEGMTAESYKQGKQDGFRESEEGFTGQIHAVIQNIEGKLERLFVDEQDRAELFEKEVISLTFKILQAAFPHLNNAYTLVELREAIRTNLDEHLGKGKVVIKLHSDNVEPIQNYIDAKFSDRSEFVELKKQKDMGPKEVAMEWSHGGAMVNLEDFQGKIEKLFIETLAGDDQNPQDSEGNQE